MKPSNKSSITGPVPGTNFKSAPRRNLSFDPEGPSQYDVKNRASLKPDEYKDPRLATNAWVIVWEPYYSNGIVNIPYRDIWSKLVSRNMDTQENAYYYRGLDVTLLTESDWNVFSENRMVGFLPMSAGRYIVLDKFEISKPLIYVEKVAKSGKYIDIITSGFPTFNMTIKAVVFGSIHIKTMQFFNIVRNLLAEGKPGRLVMYDVLNQIRVTEVDLVATLQYNRTPYYELIPKTITQSRDSSENTFVNISITGTVAEIYNERVI